MTFLLAFDTGVKTRFAIIGDEGLDEAQERWNWLVGECDRLIPGFSGDYTTVDSPFGFLEQIYLGKLIQDLQQERKDRMVGYFPKPEVLFHVLDRFYKEASQSNSVDSGGVLGGVVDFLTREILVTMDALQYFFLDIVDRKELIEKSIAWREEHRCHSHAISVCGMLEDWEKALREGDKGAGFQILVRHLAWHVLMSHEWLINTGLENVPYATICQFEQNIALRLLYSYLCKSKGGQIFQERAFLPDWRGSGRIINLPNRRNFGICASISLKRRIGSY